MNPPTRFLWLRRIAKGLGILILVALLAFGGWWLFQQYGSTKSERLAYLHEDENGTVSLWLMDKNVREPILLFSGADQIEYPVDAVTGRRSPFSPRGDVLLIQAAHGAGEKLICIDLNDGHTTILVDNASTVSGQFAPRDQRILVQEQDIVGDQSLYLLDDCDLGQRTILLLNGESVGGYFTPNGQLVIWQSDQGQTSYFLTDKKASKRTPIGGSHTVVGLSLSDDNKRVLWWTGTRELFLSDLQTETQKILMDGVDVQAAGFLAGEDWIWVQYRQGDLAHLSLLSVAGDMEYPLLIGADEAKIIELSETSQIAFGARAGDTWDVYLVDPNHHSFELILTGIENPIWQVGSKGRLFAVGSQEWRKAKLIVYDLQHKQVLKDLPSTNEIGWLDISAGGQRIAYDGLEREGKQFYLVNVESSGLETQVVDGYHPAWE